MTPRNKKELNRVSESLYPKVVIIMIIVDNFIIEPNKKIIITTERQLNLHLIKSYLYDNTMTSMLSRRKKNMFNNNNYIPNHEIHMIIITFENSEFYGLIY